MVLGRPHFPSPILKTVIQLLLLWLFAVSLCENRGGKFTAGQWAKIWLIFSYTYPLLYLIIESGIPILSLLKQDAYSTIRKKSGCNQVVILLLHFSFCLSGCNKTHLFPAGFQAPLRQNTLLSSVLKHSINIKAVFRYASIHGRLVNRWKTKIHIQLCLLLTATPYTFRRRSAEEIDSHWIVIY